MENECTRNSIIPLFHYSPPPADEQSELNSIDIGRGFNGHEQFDLAFQQSTDLGSFLLHKPAFHFRSVHFSSQLFVNRSTPIGKRWDSHHQNLYCKL